MAQTWWFWALLLLASVAVSLLLYRIRSLQAQIAEYKRTAKAFREQKGILEAVLNRMDEAVAVTDIEGKFLLVNPAVQRIFGKGAIDAPPEEWPRIYGVFHPDMKTPWTKDDLILLKAMQGIATDHAEVFVRNPQKPQGVFLRGSARPIRDEKGAVWGGVLIMHDITERKRAEAEREALIADLERRNAELERFTYTVSHDLKTPLVTIKGFLDLLERDIVRNDTRRIQADMRQIADAADSMQQLLNDLLELSRIGRVVNPSEMVSLGALARETVNLMAGHLVARGAEVTIAEEMPVVFGDRVRLLEVFQNLIGNAVKFMGDQPEPRVEVGVRHEGGRAICYVQDNGMGIDAAYQEKVFALFERLDHRVEGTGIGLALVKRIIEMHGGAIWVESEGEGRGSMFCFTIAEAHLASDEVPS